MHEQHRGWRGRASSAGLLILRVLMGSAMAVHGYEKIFHGFIPKFTEGLTQMGFPIPGVMAWLAALAEFVGGLCIVFGLGTRIAGFFVFFTMGVAFFVAHKADPWQVKELPFLFGAVALSFIFTGGGCYSLDSLLCRHKCGDETKPENQ